MRRPNFELDLVTPPVWISQCPPGVGMILWQRMIKKEIAKRENYLKKKGNNV